MKNTHRYLLIILVSAILLAGAVCIYFLTRPIPTIKIGFTGCLSGRRSQLGVSARDALQLLVQQANKNGGIHGRPIELLIEDNQGDAQVQREVVKRLIEQGVIAIVGPYQSSMGAAVLEASKGSNCLIISPTVSSDEFSKLDDNMIRIMMNASSQADPLFEHMKAQKVERVAVVYDVSNKPYTEAVLKRFLKHSNNALQIMKTIQLNQNKSPNDFVSIAKELSAAAPDAVLLISTSIDAASVCQQLAKLGKHPRYYGSTWVKTGNIIELGGRSVEGMIIAVPFIGDRKAGRYLLFAERFRELNQRDADIVAIYTWDAFHLLKTGIEKSENTLDAQNIKQAIIDMSQFDGLEEVYQIDRFGDSIRKSTLLVVNDGKFEVLK